MSNTETLLKIIIPLYIKSFFMKYLITILIASAILNAGCSHKKEYKNLEDQFPGYLVFNPKNLNQVILNFFDSNGRKTIHVPIDQLKLSNNAMILADVSSKHQQPTTNEFVNQKTKLNQSDSTTSNSGIVLPMLHCGTIWIYNHETHEMQGKFYVIDPDQVAPELPLTDNWQSFSPPTQVHITLNGKKKLVNAYLCTITFIGTIICENKCDCPPCISCIFFATPDILEPVSQPHRDADQRNYFPCGISDCD